MEKDRSRGIKHLKDKQKYKGNSTKNPKYIPSKKDKPLDSNWNRYEVQETDENALTSSTNFELLADAPISTGGFSQSKTNQVIEEEIQRQKSNSKLFCLDLEMLQRSVAAVPFYDRIGIEKKYFTEDEISEFNREASEHLERLQNFIQNLEHFSQSKTKSIKNSTSKQQSLESPSEEVSVADTDLNIATSENHPIIGYNTKEKGDEISELINNLEIDDNVRNSVKESKGINEVKKDGGDLEQWLDDILDD